MNFSKIIISVIYKIKPFIIKIIPIEILKELKKTIVTSKTNQLLDVCISPFDKKKYKKGINLIGYTKHDTGLGQSTRLLLSELQASGVDCSIIPYAQSKEYSMTDTSFDDLISEDNPYGINVFHINAHEFTMAYMNLGKKVFDNHYNIAFWLWELEEFPEEWVPCINLLDEIWTPSEFISNSLRKKTSKPVVTIPYHVTAPVNTTFNREYFSLPENQFLFLGMYDSNSISERKNPQAVIKAFKAAFDPNDARVGLVLKINHIKEQELNALKEELNGYTNVYFLLNNMTKLEVNSLIQSVDVYVSLHRAEGFGLVLAEAMLLGTPVIATNYSANTEFMNQEVACLVDYDLIELQENISLYQKGNYWADPNIETAANYMKLLANDREYYDCLTDNAKKYIQETLSMENAISIINQRFSDIYKNTEI